MLTDGEGTKTEMDTADLFAESIADEAQVPNTAVPEKAGYRTKPFQVTHGAYRLVKSFYAGTLDSRSVFGKLTRDLQRRYARHCGYDSFSVCPITLQVKISLAIGNQIFLMTFVPENGSASGGREIRTCENTLNRIITELGLKPVEKPVITLQEYLTDFTAKKAAKVKEQGNEKA